MVKKTVQKEVKITTHHSGVQNMEWVFQFWAWQLLFWSVYRYFFHLPETVDEFIVKPLVFVLPVLLYVWKKEKRSLTSIGITGKHIWTSLGIGCGFGLLFAGEAVIANILKYGGLTIQPSATVVQYGIPLMFALSLATACSEELLSRGFFFSRLFEISHNLVNAVVMSTFLFVAFHIPILLTSLRFQGTTLVLFFMTSFVLGFANSIIYHKTKSLVAPILIHFFWNMTVAVFL